MSDTSAARKRIIHRLSRAEGQIRGVKQMMREERECTDIVRQLSAVHSALEAATKDVVVHYLRECVTEAEDPDEAVRQVAELLAVTRF